MAIKHNDICDECIHERCCKMAQFGLHYPPIMACFLFTKAKQTNADRIRAMTDEELAMILQPTCPPCDKCPSGGGIKDCYECWLDWLKQEVQDETL